jgi:cobalamin synthase
LRFLTILPIPGSHRLDTVEWGRTIAWYPAVGLALGATLAGLDWGLRRFQKTLALPS